MSIEAVNWALTAPLKGTLKILLIGIANHATAEFDGARPKVETLGRYAGGCDRRTVQRNLRILEAEGWISATGEYLVNGRADRAVTIYRVNPGRQNAAPYGAARGGTDDASHGAANGSRGGTGDANGAAPTPPEPSFKEVGANAPTTPLGEHAKKTDHLPTGFPDELAPHLEAVHEILTDLAGRQRNAKAVNRAALASTLMGRPHKPLIRAAHDCAGHWTAKGNTLRDVLAAYRNWLDRTEDLAGIERVTGEVRELTARGGRYDEYDRAAGL